MAEDQAPQPQASPSRDVFISYASHDKAVAESVCKALESAGIICWIAPRDVVPGESFAGAIVHAIDATRVIVLVLSEHAATSQHVLREVERASSKRHPLIAFRIDLAPMPADFEYFLNTSQWLDASTAGVKRALPKLIDAARSALAIPSSAAHNMAGPAAAASVTRRPIRMLTALAAIIVAALGYVVVDKVWLSKRVTVEHVVGEITKAPTVEAIPDKSIAVLPFQNRSAKQDDAYFTDGIHDDILTQLAKIGAMRVIARTSVEQFRNTRLTTREIGKKLGVARVLEGGVQRAGDRVRITVQLIDATTDAHLWAESYDRKLTAANIFSIQSEIAAAIASALKAALTPAEQTRLNEIPTQNLDAWGAYQLGRQRAANRSVTGLAEAVKHFQRAIDLDPNFALAYAGLADTLMLQISWAGVPKAANFARAEQLARKAMELGPNLAESWISSAWLAEDKGDYDRAEADYSKAISLSPNNAAAYGRFARLLVLRGRVEEALTYSNKGVDLDPLSAANNFSNARDLAAAGRFDEAAVRYRKVIEVDPLRPNAYLDFALLNAQAWNRYAEAVPFAQKLVELDPDAPYARIDLAYLYVDLGDLNEAGRILSLARKRIPGSAEILDTLAWVRMFQGNEVEAASLARQALAIDPSLPDVDTLYFSLADIRRGDFARARSRYARAYPRMLKPGSPELSIVEISDALDFAYILQMTGEVGRANLLLARAEQLIRTTPRLGFAGHDIADVQALALRGDKPKALAKLREAEKAGWRFSWRYYRDFVPSLSSIRNEPEFKAVFADIERDMARQRAELAARPKNAPLNFKTPSH